MRVVFRFYAKFREQFRADSVEMDLEEASMLVEALRKLFGGAIPDGLMVAVNDKLLDGLDVKLRDGDVVDVMPPASGG